MDRFGYGNGVRGAKGFEGCELDTLFFIPISLPLLGFDTSEPDAVDLLFSSGGCSKFVPLDSTGF